MNFHYATIADTDALCRFARETFYDTYAWYNNEEDMTAYMKRSFSHEQVASEIRDADSVFLLACDNDNITGYIKLVWRKRPDKNEADGISLEIARLYCAKEHLGKGVGKLLMQECIAFAEKGHADSIWLDVWQKNERAIRFYEKWGFAVVSTWLFTLGTDIQDDFIMQKEIKQPHKR